MAGLTPSGLTNLAPGRRLAASSLTALQTVSSMLTLPVRTRAYPSLEADMPDRWAAALARFTISCPACNDNQCLRRYIQLMTHEFGQSRSQQSETRLSATEMGEGGGGLV